MEDKFRQLANLVGELAPKTVSDLADLHARKDADYGDAFGDTARELGLASALTPLNYKMRRLNNLAKAKAEGKQPNNESLSDTLVDMAAYCIMTKILIDNGDI